MRKAKVKKSPSLPKATRADEFTKKFQPAQGHNDGVAAITVSGVQVSYQEIEVFGRSYNTLLGTFKEIENGSTEE